MSIIRAITSRIMQPIIAGIGGFSNGVPWDGGSLLMPDGSSYILLPDGISKILIGVQP